MNTRSARQTSASLRVPPNPGFFQFFTQASTGKWLLMAVTSIIVVSIFLYGYYKTARQAAGAAEATTNVIRQSAQLQIAITHLNSPDEQRQFTDSVRKFFDYGHRQILVLQKLDPEFTSTTEADRKAKLADLLSLSHRLTAPEANANDKPMNVAPLAKQADTILKEIGDQQIAFLAHVQQVGQKATGKFLAVAVAGLLVLLSIIGLLIFKLSSAGINRKNAENENLKSEDKYRKLIEDAGVTIFTSDLRGSFTYVSNRCKKLTGFTPEELVGKSYADLIAPESLEMVAKTYKRQMLSGGKESVLEFPIITKSNGMRWVEQHAVLLKDNSGATTGLQCIVTDINDKKLGDLQLSNSAEITRALLNNTREGLLIVDRNFKILLINRQSARELESFAGKKVAAGMDFLQFILPGDTEQALENFAKVFNGEKVDFQAEYNTPLGPKWVLISHSPVTDDEGNIFAAAVIVHDVTEKKKQEDKLKQAEDRFRFTLEKLGDNFWEHDFETKETIFSKRGYEFLGFKKGDFETNVNLWWDNIHPDDRHLVAGNDEAYRTGNISHHSAEYRMICQNGTVKWVLDRGVVTEKSADGSPLKILGTHTDITKLKVAEEKIRESDQIIRAMLESNREGFYLIDFNFGILMINEAARGHVNVVMGKTPKIGDSILSFIPEARQSNFRNIAEKVKSGERQDTEVELDTSQGKKYFQNRYYPVYNHANIIIGLCGCTRDITENRLVDNALLKVRAEREESQYRFQSILDNTPLIVFMKDMEGRYVLVNKSFRQMLKLDEAEIIGKTDFEIDTSERAKRFEKADHEVLRSLRSTEREETIEVENGTSNLLIVKFPLFDRQKKVYGVGGIATDITENVRYRQKLIQAKKAAESAEQLQEQFLANMSHEIRTPMNGIVGMTNILLNTTLSDEQKGFIDIIRQSSDTLLFLINDILDLSKIKSGKLSIEKIPFNIRQTVENALLPFQIKAKEKNIEMKLVTDMRIPQSLSGDPHRLNQIINNLLSNALKFTDSGYISLTMEVKRQNEGQVTVRFIVKDTGVGVPTNKLASIFNSFEQATSSTARKFGGTGLGLAITKQLIEMQGGKISVESIVGSGTEFTIDIPYQFHGVDHIPVNDQLLISRSGKNLAGKKILIAEDNEINQKVIFHILKREEIATTITNNGKEAIDLLERGEVFDLVILDLQMPEMDGFQTTVYIRQRLGLTIPVLAMTASALRQERTKCLELGMNEYITKPFSSEDLLKQLRRFLLPEGNPGANHLEGQKKYYNMAALVEKNDQQFCLETLQTFLDTIPVSIEEMRESAHHDNWMVLIRIAGGMKKRLEILGVSPMLKLVQEIEETSYENTVPAELLGKIKQLQELFELVRPMIEHELSSVSQQAI